MNELKTTIHNLPFELIHLLIKVFTTVTHNKRLSQKQALKLGIC